MADFNGILKEAIDGGESLESAMRKAGLKDSIENLFSHLSGTNKSKTYRESFKNARRDADSYP